MARTYDEIKADEWIELGAGDREAFRRVLSQASVIELAHRYRGAAEQVEEFPESPIDFDIYNLVVAELRRRDEGRR